MPRISGRALRLLFCLVAVPLAAEVQVSLVPPGLANLPPGTAALGKLLAQQVDLAAADIEAVINATLDKPLVLGAFGQALSLALLPASQGPAWKGRAFSLSASAGGALVGDSYDVPTWLARFAKLRPESDYRLGVAVLPDTVKLAVSLDPWLSGVSLKAFGGYLDYQLKTGVDLKTWSAGGGASWLALPPWTPVRAFAWRGLLLDAGYGYASNLVSVVLALDTVKKRFSFTPSPFLPLTFSVDLQVDPRFDVAFETWGQAVPLQASTGITLFDVLSLTLGGGGVWTRGQASLGLSGNQPIGLTISSQLGSDFLDPTQPGRIDVSGAASKPPVEEWSAYVYAGLEVRAGALYFQLPFVAYDWDTGFSASVALGLSL